MLPITPEFAEERGWALVQLVEQDLQDHMPRYRRVREARDLYFGTGTGDLSLPWEGASNIHIPLLMEKVETLVPQLMSAFWGAEPIVNVQRVPEEFYAEQTEDVEQYINFVVRKDIPDFYDTFESWLRNMSIDGMGFVYPWWEYKLRMVTEVHRLKKAYDIGEATPLGQPIESARFKTSTELLVELFGVPDVENGLVRNIPAAGEMTDEEFAKWEHEPEGTQWIIEFCEDRIFQSGFVVIRPARHVDEIELHVRRQIVDREGVCTELLEYDQVVLPYRTRSIQKADRVTRRYWLTVDEIDELVAKGEWSLSAADMEMLRASALREVDSSAHDPKLQTQRDKHTGETVAARSAPKVTLPEDYAPYNKNKIQVFQMFLRDAVEPGGERCEVVYHIPHPLRKIVRAEYLDESHPNGKRPIICAKYIPVSDRAYGLGLGDQLVAINLECNTIINYVNNAQELITNPFFFYEPTALTADSQGLTNLRPGQGVPVQSVQGIRFPDFTQLPMQNMEIMTSLLMFADRLTVSPMHGGSTQMKNAPRTARGTMALLGEGHVKIDMLITRLQLGPWTDLIEHIYALHQSFAPDEKWYYVTRETERVPVRMSRKMLRNRQEFYFKGNTANTNRAILQQLAQVRYSTLMANPDYATDPNVRRELVRDFLKYWGDGADPDRLLPALPGVGAYQHPPMSQKDENQAMILGVPMDVLPTDDDASHLADMNQFERTPTFDQMPGHAVGIYAMHKHAHQESMRQKSATQRTAVDGGMANNVPQGVSLAPPTGNEDTNVLEGGNVR